MWNMYRGPCIIETLEFFRIEFYSIYRIYKICRKLYLVVLKIKITFTNPVDSVEILILVILKIKSTKNSLLQILQIL